MSNAWLERQWNKWNGRFEYLLRTTEATALPLDRMYLGETEREAVAAVAETNRRRHELGLVELVLRGR